MKHLILGALTALLFFLTACAGPDSSMDGDANASVGPASLPEMRYYMIADA